MLASLFLLLALLTAGLLSPGPDMLLILRSSASGRGRAAGLATAAGIVTGLTVHVTYCAAGLGWLVTRISWLQTSLRWLGAAYLLWIAWKILTAPARSAPASGSTTPAPANLAAAYRDGLFCNLLNPKVALFLISLFSQFLGPGTSPALRLGCAALIVLHAAATWSLLVILLDRPALRAWLAGHETTLNRVFAALLALFAIRLAL